MSSQTSPSSIWAPIQIGSSLSTACLNKALAAVRGAAFWAAVVLPLAYVPAAYGAMGFETWSPLALIAVHMACVVIGHEHNSSNNDTPSHA
ncbi:hypothetical protein FK85_28710 [Halorubrum saccharovorum]|uniref:Uncharacterized protein n=1 Tax=Halorubrum saccharovorum TaxID=2248 RepID=A0A0F8AUT5_9EURY|nr:hypothetical protein [Halorubrum saccharovorum]KKF39406.1 hypothetical protein FK85_28710 [Halorubrum saccharovorum]